MLGVEVRRSEDRFTTVAPARADAAAGWATTRHSFSFGEHYDPNNIGFGPLVALNDETVRAGELYPEHTHRDVEIVTWVISGALQHSDSSYADEDEDVVTLVPGNVQVLSAGAGVRHTEGAAQGSPVHFVQTWVRPDESGGPPDWSGGGVAPRTLASEWVLAASGSDPEALVRLRSRGTSLWVTRIAVAEERTLPEAPAAYALVARGAIEVDGVGRLDEGDALRITTPAPLAVRGLEPAELLVWTFA